MDSMPLRVVFMPKATTAMVVNPLDSIASISDAVDVSITGNDKYPILLMATKPKKANKKKGKGAWAFAPCFAVPYFASQ